MRVLLFALLVVVFGANAHADVPREPPTPRPSNASPPPKPAPTPGKKACGVGAGLALLAIGVFGAWRLSKSSPRAVEPVRDGGAPA